MLTRVLTAVIGIPIVILLMVVGTPYLEIVGLLIALIGVYEFYHMVRKKYNVIPWIGYISVAVYICCIRWMGAYFLQFVTCLVLFSLIVMVFTHPKHSIADLAMTIFAPIYVGVFLGFILLIRALDYGQFLVWFVFISAWGSDTCAYFAGRFLGRHKLAPQLSPNKTVEGAIGGAIGATVIAVLYTVIYQQFAPILPGRFAFVFILGVVFIASILSQLGDLAASAIKRNIGEKDFGHLFPGHGGVLDRFDSILFVAPFIYLTLSLLR